MSKTILIAGSSGMIGALLLNHCLADPEVSKVRCVVRKPSGRSHDKLQEIQVADFEDYRQHLSIFKEVDVAYFCLGVYTGQVPDDAFKKITVTYAVAFGDALQHHSPGATLCLLSGAGADRTEKSRTSFARYKGMAENQLSAMNLTFYSFRPGYIYPVEKRDEPNFSYRLMRWLYPLIKALGPKYSITSVQLAKAMYIGGFNGAPTSILENQDIIHLLENQ